jgi:hypothetical protein
MPRSCGVCEIGISWSGRHFCPTLSKVPAVMRCSLQHEGQQNRCGVGAKATQCLATTDPNFRFDVIGRPIGPTRLSSAHAVLVLREPYPTTALWTSGSSLTSGSPKARGRRRSNTLALACVSA